jgi:hypothetical protein
MPKKRAHFAEGDKFEGLQDLVLKLTRQMRDMVPPPHVLKGLNDIEAKVAQMRKRGMPGPALI